MTATTKMTAEQYFEAALKGVESSSIREWASSSRNRPIFLKMAQGALGKGTDVDLFTALIVSLAIGL